MPNDVARRVRAVGARLRSCSSRARRVGDGCAAPGALGAPGAHAARMRGGGGGSAGRLGVEPRVRRGVASRRRLAHLGELGACASERAAQRPSEGLRGLR
eukprot:2477616-Prymnesium_polylepis.1